jgi:lipopolysaccharide export system protein LptA
MVILSVPRMVKAAASGVLAALLAALVGSPFAAAQIAAFNSNAPVDYAADRIELQDRQKRVVLSGNVDISQGDLRLRAGRTTVAYTDAGTLRIQRIDATGGVTVARGGETASGNVAIYDFNRRIITMIGDVRLRRGTDTLNGGRLVMDLNSGVSSVDGRSGGLGGPTGTGRGGRVSGSFSVPQRGN